MQTREVLDAMRSDADLTELKLLRVDGGASHNALLMQLQADILQVPVDLKRCGVMYTLFPPAYTHSGLIPRSRCFCSCMSRYCRCQMLRNDATLCK